jgi:DNA-binding transcriptional LysR family regulator
MEMHQVRYFLAVAQHLNFSRAAEECNVLVTVRGRPRSPGVGALVREAMRKKWFGKKAVGQNDAQQ